MTRVEVIKKVVVNEDQDKVHDTDISRDEKGLSKIFESVANPDDPESVDILSHEFLLRSKVSQIQILLGDIKKHISATEEACIKIEYVKKLYS